MSRIRREVSRRLSSLDPRFGRDGALPPVVRCFADAPSAHPCSADPASASTLPSSHTVHAHPQVHQNVSGYGYPTSTVKENRRTVCRFSVFGSETMTPNESASAQ